MFVVNFVHAHWGLPANLSHHNTYCSYADTIMPQFFFAVGLAYRWTFLRRATAHGDRAAYRHALVRNLKLLALGVLMYGILSGAFLTPHFLEKTFQTLTTIAVTSIWVLPVVARAPWVRAGFLCISAGIHLMISHCFYFDYTQGASIDGGPLGFLSWTAPLLAGTLACDIMQRMRTPASVVWNGALGSALMGAGYLLSCTGRFMAAAAGTRGDIPLFAAFPFTPANGPIDMWTMNQQAGSVSYLLFAAGFAWCVLALWQVLSDLGPIRIPALRTLGQNALAAYLAHFPAAALLWLVIPDEWPPIAYLLPIGLYLVIMWCIMRLLERKGWYLKL
jgi:hypothetical protein